MYLIDPKTGEKSVTLTLLLASAVALFIAGGLQVAGQVSNVGPFMELTITFSALYFSRRITIAGKVFNSDQAAQIVEKVSQ